MIVCKRYFIVFQIER